MSVFDLHICSVFAVHSFVGLQDFQQKMRHVQKASYNCDSIFEHGTLQCNLELNNSHAIT